ncbi:hypothetical protein GCM10009584_30560 [Ornithinimicrobium humiphilum]|uniref:Matrixin n=1 Tax=Ornithinimicrobium humiphilum TaxID=125288 RepID=A0A543K6T6_9MICO|nr:hypothetical protein [Ornithinimicrobium humiphilum]TQM90782.1 hypothetical protein FB476_3166 [Ornithinimicrobium humiphilum]
MGLFESAARKRRAAELARRLAELDEWDRRYGLGGAPPGHPAARPDTGWRVHSTDGLPPLRALDPVRPVPAPRRRRGGSTLVVLVVALVAAVIAFPTQATEVRSWATAAGRSVLGMPATESAAGGGTRWGDGLGEVVQRWSPPPGAGLRGWEPPRGERVLPTVDPGTSDAYAYLQTQPGGDDPVGFSPCGPVEVVVNPEGAPDGWTELVRGSLDRVGAASGLALDLVGESDEVWSEEPRELGSPVLVSWSDADAVPQLAGQAAGLGGPTTVEGPDRRVWHASGQVVLDRDDLARPEQHAAVLDHELAHVLGLGHVDDIGQLMAPVNTTGRIGFGPGDLAGLARIGAIGCPGDA